jgi:hypothetical protein
MSRYAEGTSVSVERSQAEILRNLRRYGADAFAFGEEDGCGIVQFKLRGWPIRFRLQLPDREATEFQRTPTRGKERSPIERLRLWEQACRQKWRALSLFILATLEAVESGIIPFEHAWMPYCLLASRETVGEHFGQTLSKAIESGVMPRLLLPGPGMKES